MFQFLTVVTFNFFFKNVLLMFIFHHIQARSRRFYEFFLNAIFFFDHFCDHFFVFILKMILILIFFLSYENVFHCSKKIWILFNSFLNLSFWLIVFFWMIQFECFYRTTFKINENCVIHQLNINFLIWFMKKKRFFLFHWMWQCLIWSF